MEEETKRGALHVFLPGSATLSPGRWGRRGRAARQTEESAGDVKPDLLPYLLPPSLLHLHHCHLARDSQSNLILRLQTGNTLQRREEEKKKWREKEGERDRNRAEERERSPSSTSKMETLPGEGKLSPTTRREKREQSVTCLHMKPPSASDNQTDCRNSEKPKLLSWINKSWERVAENEKKQTEEGRLKRASFWSVTPGCLLKKHK